jgi:anthranilate synthase component I
MINPGWEEYQQLAERKEIVPIVEVISGDLETPVSLYKKVAGESEYSFLLESAERPGTIGRYSFIGLTPRLIFKSRGNCITVTENGKTRRWNEHPIKALRKLLKRYRGHPHPDLPRFVSGAVGYFSYDMVRYFEDLPDNNPDDLKFPDSYFVFVDAILAMDHLNHTISIIANAFVDPADPKGAYNQARDTIKRLKRLISRRTSMTDYLSTKKQGGRRILRSNVDRSYFEKSVEKAREYIVAGDIFQVVLSQRFQAQVASEPFDIYRALRRTNPSPYMFYLSFKDLQIIGSSPEVLVKAEDNVATIRPLAGTMPRGKTVEEDEALARKLLRDQKERAEHTMLVDLARNDLGRICKYGSVSVPARMKIEHYSHVMHISSHVHGKIRPDVDQLDIFGAGFPAGTVSGAPKIRSMEIIDELETTRRGIYSGAVGNFDLAGNLDFCITLRTIIHHKGKAYLQAGAGVVYDSDPAKEFQETVNKAGALIRSIEMVEGCRYDLGD